VPAYQIYQAFGIGGWNNEKNDGEELTGHLHASPHALGLTAIHHPAKARDGWTYLVQMEVLSPLNVVESLFLASENGEPSVVANSLKSGWNLLLQTLGWTRTIAGADYAAHKAAQQNEFIANGFSRLMHAPWQNPQNRFDVNGKDGVTPLDVLIVIAFINARPADVSLPSPPELPPPYYDVSGNGECSPLDVLMVIQQLNSQLQTGGEGENTNLPTLLFFAGLHLTPDSLGDAAPSAASFLVSAPISLTPASPRPHTARVFLVEPSSDTFRSTISDASSGSRESLVHSPHPDGPLEEPAVALASLEPILDDIARSIGCA